MNAEPVPVPGFPGMPYSQAMRVGDLVFVAGQSGLNVRTGQISDDVEDQARQAFENLAAVLHAAGSSPQQVVKTTVILTGSGLRRRRS
jgi:2-iminobutanoate/2-iminopropanoate deaminase